jgi:hypothetical protein
MRIAVIRIDSSPGQQRAVVPRRWLSRDWSIGQKSMASERMMTLALTGRVKKTEMSLLAAIMVPRK